MAPQRRKVWIMVSLGVASLIRLLILQQSLEPRGSLLSQWSVEQADQPTLSIHDDISGSTNNTVNQILRQLEDENQQLRDEVEQQKSIFSRQHNSGTKEAAANDSSLKDSLIFFWNQLVQQGSNTRAPCQQIFPNLKPRLPVSSSLPSLPLNDIVLATHGSASKMDMILTQLGYWNGPSSVALYVNDGATQIDHVLSFLSDHEERLSNASIHLFLEYDATSTTTKKSLGYPHNPLRNLAMDYCGSDYFVALDADFIPGPPNSYERLMATCSAKGFELQKEMRKMQRVMVIPAFEVFAKKNETKASPDQLPPTKSALSKLVEANLAESFHYSRYADGHAATGFPKWFQHDTSPSNSGPSWYPIRFDVGFEPYVLAYRPGIPRYWNAFRGFGENKVSWFQELHRAGYSFGTLTDTFVVHLEHPSTHDWRHRRDNIKLREVFLDYLDSKYPLVNNRISPNKVRVSTSRPYNETTTKKPASLFINSSNVAT